MKRVSYLYPPAYHYRAPFNDRLRAILAKSDVDYRVVYSDLGASDRFKNDTIDYDWGYKVPLTRLPGGLNYQHAFSHAMKSDLVIIQQESRLAINYPLQLLSMLRRKKVAFFGHGRNFQSRNPDGMEERLKRIMATRVDWWFAYTDQTKSHVASLGFPENRITVFENAVDTSETMTAREKITPTERAAIASRLGIKGSNVGVFVGSIYPDRRLDYLMDAANRIRSQVPDFELLFVGGGPSLDHLSSLAAGQEWVKILGPMFGAEKVAAMATGSIFLMPGLVGLGILDAAAAGLPTVTTAFPYHSPEIAYLEDGVNGVMVDDWQNPDAYAGAVVELLNDRPRLSAMQDAARLMAQRYSVEAMAERFAEGVLKALALP